MFISIADGNHKSYLLDKWDGYFYTEKRSAERALRDMARIEGEHAMTFSPPPDPIAAVTHPNPYPYYAALVAHQPLYRDAALGLWVASSAERVTAVLTSDLCRVRPAAEPVPRALLGSPAGDIFGHLVRMNDGAYHRAFKGAVSATLQALEPARVLAESRRWARALLADGQAPDASFLQEGVIHLSTYVIASLLGVPDDRLYQTALWVGDFARCLAPASTAEQIERGKLAADRLLNLFHTLAQHQPAPAGNLYMTLAEQAREAGCEERQASIANSIGFLSQAYEATAGLIGNALVALAAHPDVSAQVMADVSLLPALVQEVLRCDSPVQNTRRFVAQAGMVAGQQMQAGEVVLLVLAAANRDPAANHQPAHFDLFRTERRIFSFGAGAHACPGDALAGLIAQAALEHVLASRRDLASLTKTVTYRPSANTRIALLGAAEQH
jgi:cytochrome P450